MLLNIRIAGKLFFSYLYTIIYNSCFRVKATNYLLDEYFPLISGYLRISFTKYTNKWKRFSDKIFFKDF